MSKFTSICAIAPGWVARLIQPDGQPYDVPIVAIAIRNDGWIDSVIMMQDGPMLAAEYDNFAGVFPAPADLRIPPLDQDGKA